MENGTSFGAPTALETELAELIVNAVPSIELVRMVNSGTEATMSAIRVARGYTGRGKVIKIAGCYHGHVDALLAKAGSGVATFGLPDCEGVPTDFTSHTLVVPFNDADAVRRTIEANDNQVACLIIEPIAGNMGVIPPHDGYLAELREITSEHGILLIFDEVITGFRVAYGGAQSLFGVAPDITTMGKIIGGGLPVGAYGGRRDVMEMVAPLGPMYQAGTLSGNPLAVTAGVATLKELQRPETYERLEASASRLTDGIAAVFSQAEIPASINRVGSMFTGFFNPGPVATLSEVEKSDTITYGRYFHALLERGVYIAPSQFEAGFVSVAHTDEDIDRTIVAVGEALSQVS